MKIRAELRNHMEVLVRAFLAVTSCGGSNATVEIVGGRTLKPHEAGCACCRTRLIKTEVRFGGK